MRSSVLSENDEGPLSGASVVLVPDGATARQPPEIRVKPIKAKVAVTGVIAIASLPLAVVTRNPPGSEDALIARLVAQLGARHPAVELGIGDDAAVLAGGWCTSLDLLIEDVHFRMRTTSARDLGWKAIAVNLSDLAAMGAEPVCALVGLGLPAGHDARRCWTSSSRARRVRGRLRCSGRRRRHEPRARPDALGHRLRPRRPTRAPRRRAARATSSA